MKPICDPTIDCNDECNDDNELCCLACDIWGLCDDPCHSALQIAFAAVEIIRMREED